MISSKQTAYTGPPALKPVDFTKKMFQYDLVISFAILLSGTVVKNQSYQMSYSQSLLRAHWMKRLKLS